MKQFIDGLWLQQGLSDNTLKSYTNDLKSFALWVKQCSKDVFSIEEEELESYVRVRREAGLSANSIARLLACLRNFYSWLLKHKYIEHDPTIFLSNPRTTRKIPTCISEEQVTSLLAAPDCSTELGMRDKAMLELLYASGLRVSELINLELSDMNLQQGVIKIFGKGNRQRMLPIGEIAEDEITKYLEGARTGLLNGKQCDKVFVSMRGTGMTRQTFWYRIKYYAAIVNLDNLSPHGLRHAFATHILNNGADLVIVKELLGHKSISTTQIYTHVAKARLQEIYQQHHPRA
ncbi:MAG: site-specific tyrosine recombinase XerD [Alcanivoracaceae bacterium]|nr:site-specific tyrosine recombinase XerD [Alcanivoracaceae bacterium]